MLISFVSTLFRGFLLLGKKYKNILVPFLVQMKTSRFAFEIYWPFCWSLAKNLSISISLKLENPYNHKFEYPHFHKLYRNLEIPSDSQSADLTDEELNRILRLLINNRKAEPVAEELRRIGGGRRSYGRGSSGGKTEGQTVKTGDFR